MKITSFEIYPIHLPFHHPASDSLGTYHASNHGVVVIQSESGHMGIGEVSLAWFGGAHALLREMKEIWQPLFLNQDCFRIAYLMEKLHPYLAFSKRHLLARAAVEMALCDLWGNIQGIPVYQLLGGKYRDSIPLTGGVNIDTIEQMVETAKLKVKEGYKELKIKIGTKADQDIRSVEKIRNAIPDEIALRVDANMAWKDVKKAKMWIDELVQHGVHIVEQPLAEHRLEDLRWLRQQVQAKILLDESVWGIEDAKRCLDASAGDLLHVYVSEAGGILAAKAIFELASLYDVPCTIGSMPEARIGTSASLHLGVAMSNLSSYASDIRGYTIYKNDIVQEELQLKDGSLYVSDQPGLGVTLDLEKLKKMTVN